MYVRISFGYMCSLQCSTLLYTLPTYGIIQAGLSSLCVCVCCVLFSAQQGPGSKQSTGDDGAVQRVGEGCRGAHGRERKTETERGAGA